MSESPTTSPTAAKEAAPWLLWLLLAAILFAAGVYAGTALYSGADTTPEIDGVYLQPPQALPPFELRGDDGERFTAADLRGGWTLIYFGYTFCPDVCPMTLAQAAKAGELLAERDAGDDIRYLLISVDPARDTPQRLAEYLSSFGPDFRGATGERGQLDTLSEALGVFYQIHDPEPGQDYYLVDHSSALLLVNPQAELQAVFTPPFTPAALAKDLQSIKEHASS